VALVHHELCFGCGRVNLFGLLLEVTETAPGSVAGRCFIKQDHQGADPGSAHEGVVAAALSEAMALACGKDARAMSVEVNFKGPAPVGAFLDIQAQLEARAGGELVHARATATATAMAAGGRVASARGSFRL
jgi:acyl-coenzyme A thioesterase PaaI-like protein